MILPLLTSLRCIFRRGVNDRLFYFCLLAPGARAMSERGCRTPEEHVSNPSLRHFTRMRFRNTSHPIPVFRPDIKLVFVITNARNWRVVLHGGTRRSSFGEICRNL